MLPMGNVIDLSGIGVISQNVEIIENETPTGDRETG